MSFYSSRFETDWAPADIGRDEATRRAYAIGVAEKLGEENRAELQALYAAVESTYARSLVELAYQEGRQEATAAAQTSDDAEVWADLVEGDPIEIVATESLSKGRDGLPEAIGIGELFDRVDADSTDVLDRPDFLEK